MVRWLPVPLLPSVLAAHAHLKSAPSGVGSLLWSGGFDLTRTHPAKNLAAIRGTGRPWARLAVVRARFAPFAGLWTAMIINDPLHHHDYPSLNTIAGVMRLG
ncbi:hypothetical protein HD601_002556 [Jiangella mangrovi]|uniref:Uncharacterized protein n=1 Tax=Jiangella mangrovi TaxID=1524084 RepID=A0A7W9GQN7_9ACTN|nr:hypothetical protein [Jiangella mangrovi]